MKLSQKENFKIFFNAPLTGKLRTMKALHENDSRVKALYSLHTNGRLTVDKKSIIYQIGSASGNSCTSSIYPEIQVFLFLF